MICDIFLDLSDNKIIRSRRVYHFVEFIAEVSGFADIFMVFSALILGSLYQPSMLKAYRLKHIS